MRLLLLKIQSTYKQLHPGVLFNYICLQQANCNTCVLCNCFLGEYLQSLRQKIKENGLLGRKALVGVREVRQRREVHALLCQVTGSWSPLE